MFSWDSSTSDSVDSVPITREAENSEIGEWVETRFVPMTWPDTFAAVSTLFPNP
jgi:hypothetical protein